MSQDFHDLLIIEPGRAQRRDVGVAHLAVLAHQLQREIQQLGYANASALSRLFSQKMGASPRQWLDRRDTAS